MARSPPRKSAKPASRTSGRAAAKKAPARNASKARTGARPNGATRSSPTARANGGTRAAARSAQASRATRTTRTNTATATLVQAPRVGMVTHTEFASSDPAASRAALSRIFGWEFSDFPQPDGSSYAMWRGPNNTGGGIRAVQAGLSPHAVPYVEAKTVDDALGKVQSAGGQVILPRTEIGNGMGAIAMCALPGGIQIGIWAPR